jgi:hypothetical protein
MGLERRLWEGLGPRELSKRQRRGSSAQSSSTTGAFNEGEVRFVPAAYSLSGQAYYLLRIPGMTRNGYVCHCVRVDEDGLSAYERVSTQGPFWGHVETREVPAVLVPLLAQLLADPPYFEKPARPRRPPGVGRLPPFCPSPAAGRARPLDRILAAPTFPAVQWAGSAEALRAAGLGLLALPTPRGACCVMRRVDTAVSVWRAAGERVPLEEVLLRCVHGPIGPRYGRRAHPGRAPTLATRRSSQLVVLRGAGSFFAGVPQECELMGLPPHDPLHALLCAEDPGRAHSLLFRGVSVHTSAAVFESLRSSAALPAGRWRVMSAYTGCGTFLAGLRTIGQPYVLVGAGDIDPSCRALIEAVNLPGVAEHAGARWYADSRSDEATLGAPPSDLLLGGFECTTVSGLNRHTSETNIRGTIADLRAVLRYVHAHRPAAFVLENVTRWKAESLQWALAELNALLEELRPLYHLPPPEVLCCSWYGAAMARPRLIWVGVRR